MSIVVSRVMVESAWMSAGEVAQRLLAAELIEAGVQVPDVFGAGALESALVSIRRWTAEGRLFAIDGLYPRYQFDDRMQPLPVLQEILREAVGRDEVALGRWMARPNAGLRARTPAELLASAPERVLEAWRRQGGVS